MPADMRVGIPLGLIITVAVSAPSVDWGRFRGPNGAGVAEGAALPDVLSSANVAWETSIPPGSSSPALTEDRIFLTAYEGVDFVTLAFRAQ